MSIIRVKKENVKDQQALRKAKLDTAGKNLDRKTYGPNQIKFEMRNNKSNHIHN